MCFASNAEVRPEKSGSSHITFAKRRFHQWPSCTYHWKLYIMGKNMEKILPNQPTKFGIYTPIFCIIHNMIFVFLLGKYNIKKHQWPSKGDPRINKIKTKNQQSINQSINQHVVKTKSIKSIKLTFQSLIWSSLCNCRLKISHDFPIIQSLAAAMAACWHFSRCLGAVLRKNFTLKCPQLPNG